MHNAEFVALDDSRFLVVPLDCQLCSLNKIIVSFIRIVSGLNDMLEDQFKTIERLQNENEDKTKTQMSCFRCLIWTQGILTVAANTTWRKTNRF